MGSLPRKSKLDTLTSDAFAATAAEARAQPAATRSKALRQMFDFLVFVFIYRPFILAEIA